MNIPVVIEALKELSDWLDGSKSNQERPKLQRYVR